MQSYVFESVYCWRRIDNENNKRNDIIAKSLCSAESKAVSLLLTPLHCLCTLSASSLWEKYIDWISQNVCFFLNIEIHVDGKQLLEFCACKKLKANERWKLFVFPFSIEFITFTSFLLSSAFCCLPIYIHIKYIVISCMSFFLYFAFSPHISYTIYFVSYYFSSFLQSFFQFFHIFAFTALLSVLSIVFYMFIECGGARLCIKYRVSMAWLKLTGIEQHTNFVSGIYALT